MIRNIVFDIGQVLVNYDWKSYLEEFGFGEETNRIIAEAVFLNPAWNESDRGICTRKELEERFAANAPEYAQEIRKVFAGAGRTVTARAYAPAWVEELKAKGFRVYFLSNYAAWCYEDTKEILEQFLAKMDGGIFSFQVHQIKPGEEIYRELLRRYALDAGECLFIDDREENVRAAEALGMHGHVFAGYEEARKAICEY